MKLSSVQIKNFRSISDLNLKFDFNCQTLIGINESGKSNVLRALNLLDPTVSPSPGDLRIERHDEAQVSDGLVRFSFEPDEEEVNSIVTEMASHFEEASLSIPIVTNGTTQFTMEAYCRQKNGGSHGVCDGIHSVLIPSGKRSQSYWARPKNEQLLPGWFKNTSTSSVPIAFAEDGVKTVPANGFVFLPSGIEAGGESSLSPATIEELNGLIGKLVMALVADKLPKCIFWKYADQYLLPSSIDVAAFCANPDSCVPLKSMFELAGYSSSNLAELINKAQALGHYRYVQILEKTASTATEHIRAAWRDYKNVRIKLESHGAFLSPIIVDDVVPLDMSNRSDGFKRFVSFLLQISAKVRTNEINGALILIDEPEIALHPSGAKNLMQELVSIGKSNTVVFSTHSIFMIDKEEIGRHLVVEKNKEITTTWRAEKSRIQDEEVLYSAMGFSIFEALKAQNVIFEGWRDKRLFDVTAAAMSKADNDVKNSLSGIGFTFADGVKDVRNVARFLELASRPCLVVSDADNAALQHRKAYAVPGAWGEWKTLKEILPGSTVLTGEDLLERSAVVKRANKFRGSISGLGALDEAFFRTGEATIAGLKRWLETAGLGTALDEKLNELKDALFTDIKRADISAEAEEIVRFILRYDFALNRPTP